MLTGSFTSVHRRPWRLRDGGSQKGNHVAQSNRTHVELLSIAILDIRAIVESMLRSVTNAESCVEHFLRRADHDTLGVLSEHLSQVTIDSEALPKSIAAAREPLLALLDTPPSVT